MLTAFLVSVGSLVLLAAPNDAINCYDYVCGISTNTYYMHTFNESCVDPFSTTGKAKCNGTQCLTQWLFLWQVADHVNLTTSGVSRTCVIGQDMEPLPISTLDDCVGLSQKYTSYRDKSFFVYENQCCYKTYDHNVYSGSSYTHCFCLTDNCNDKPYQPVANKGNNALYEQNAVGASYTRLSLVVIVAIAASLMSEKFI